MIIKAINVRKHRPKLKGIGIFGLNIWFVNILFNQRGLTILTLLLFATMKTAIDKLGEI